VSGAASSALTPNEDERSILRRVGAEEALRRGLADDAEIAARLEAIERAAAIRAEEALRDALFATVRDALVLDDAALRTHYEATKTRYAQRAITLRRRAFGSREAAQQAMSATPSVDGAETEVIGPVAVRDLPRTVLPEALELTRPGSRAVAGSDVEGWSILELVEIRPADSPPFEAVRAEVEASLRQREAVTAFRTLLTELRGKSRGEAAREIANPRYPLSPRAESPGHQGPPRAAEPAALPQRAAVYPRSPRFPRILAPFLRPLVSCGPEGRMFESCWARQAFPRRPECCCSGRRRLRARRRPYAGAASRARCSSRRTMMLLA
jgi:hypothetical protein